MFEELGRLIDQSIAWLGERVADFLRALIRSLEKIWKTLVVASLIAAFGVVATLYVIFYASYLLGETIMEVWDPRNPNKPSEVFKVRKGPQNTPLPKNRSEAKVLVLEQ